MIPSPADTRAVLFSADPSLDHHRLSPPTLTADPEPAQVSPQMDSLTAKSNGIIQGKTLTFRRLWQACFNSAE